MLRLVRFLELLRPVGWLLLEAQVDFTASLQDVLVGRMIDLDLAEMGAAGPAVITSVRPCPPIKAAGAGRQVITGLFQHSAGNVLDVYLAGRPEPIGTTANHPFWSEDRREFVRADALRPGERLRSATGSLCRVSRLVPHAAREIVYNLEVDGEHVYYVSASGVLVHNQYLTRFGAGPETLEELSADAARAAANGFPHGVSTRLSSRIDKKHRNALFSDVEKHFTVEQTGKRSSHHTVHLPDPLTDDVVDQFNSLFTPLVD